MSPQISLPVQSTTPAIHYTRRFPVERTACGKAPPCPATSELRYVTCEACREVVGR